MNDSEQRMQKMRSLLNEQLSPTYLDIIDDSAQHRGHIGAKQGMGHYTVIIDSPYFEGQSLIKCHKMVYTACDSMMNQSIHALSIQIRRSTHDPSAQ